MSKALQHMRERLVDYMTIILIVFETFLKKILKLHKGILKVVCNVSGKFIENGKQ